MVFILGTRYLNLRVLRLRMGEVCCKRTRHKCWLRCCERKATEVAQDFNYENAICGDIGSTHNDKSCLHI